jgi:hypothetical protein
MTTPTAKIVKTDRIDRHDGIDAYGLHIEYLRFYRESMKLHSQVQVFLTGNNVYVYQRAKGSKKARWSGLQYADHAAAREQVRTLLAKSESDSIGAVVRGVPTLVQLTESDIESIKNGQKPSARYDGGTRNNRLFGKIDDETWVPE